jgi:uncharacterized protein YbjT (DUF2867 family)
MKEGTMFVITGATGRTGAVAAKILLQGGHDVRVVVRNEAAAEAWRGQGAEAAIADYLDEAALIKAFNGADHAYVMTPPLVDAADLLAARAPIEANLLKAAQINELSHVVLLSAVGAEHESGTGHILGLHRMEQKLGQTGISHTCLRAAYFMENWAPVLAPARDKGLLPSFIAPTGLAVDMVSSRDVGRAVAHALLDPVDGRRVIGVAGPRQISPDDVAAALAGLLGRDVTPSILPRDQWDGIWQTLNWSPDRCRLYGEFFENLNSGHVVFADDLEIWRGEDPIRDVLETLLAG